MTNWNAYLAWYTAVYWDLDRVVFGTVAECGDVGMGGAVDQAVYWGLDRIVCAAIAAREAPPHPGLAFYLGSVA